MIINKIIQNKALPSFCTSNVDALNSILYFCKINKLPCLIECTSNQVNQDGGYTNKTPKLFINEIFKMQKKINFDKKKLFLGGDHLGPLPWKNNNSHTAIKNSVKLIDSFLKEKFCKIHIDTSIKCKNDKHIDNDIIFNRTNQILRNPAIFKKIKDRFIIIGTEVPLSGSGDSKKIIKTSKQQINNESLRFKKILKSIGLKNNFFGLVIEPGMRYMHSSITQPNFKDFKEKRRISIKNNFVFEAHSTDYQSLKTLKQLVKNNFKYLKVGPEITFNYSRSLFFMQNLEKKIVKKKCSNLKAKILSTMLDNSKHWKEYYKRKDKKLFLDSKLDRLRYYLNSKKVVNSINLLKKNVNKLDKKIIYPLINQDLKKDFIFYSKKKLSNFDLIKLIFISKSLKKYFKACGFKVS